MNITDTAYKTRGQSKIFLGNVAEGLAKPIRKFIEQMGYGILSKGSVMLSEVVRALDEDIAPIKTENRLSRNLCHAKIEETLTDNLLEVASNSIGKDSLLILDPTDIIKKYGKKMENLRQVRDGSTGGFGMGYPIIQVVAVNSDDKYKLIPLYSRLYSHSDERHRSENKEILDAVERIAKVNKNKGIWVIDRGADRINLIKPIIEMGQRFIIRSVGTRHVIYNKQKIAIKDLAQRCTMKYETNIIRQKKEGEEHLKLSYGFISFSLKQCPDVSLRLVVVKGFGEDPLMLMTNCDLRANAKIIWRIADSYITRWRIEEAIRFIKQSFDLENIRVLTYQRLKNLVVIVNVVAYFIAKVLDDSTKLKILSVNIITISKRMFGIPDMRLYAIADGVRELFQKCPPKKFINPPDSRQLPLIT